MKHVVVLCGGRSAEHEVSLMSTCDILKNLDQIKYRISVLGIRKDGLLYAPEILRAKLGVASDAHFHFPSADNWVCSLSRLDPPVDIVFPVLHGPFGEDGTVQGALEVLHLPYVGAGVWGSAVGMNKIQSKKILAGSGLPVLPYFVVHPVQWRDEPESVAKQVEKQLRYPLFIKPANMGSSVGISKSKNRRQLFEHIPIAFRYDESVVVEQGIEAREIEISVIGNWRPRVSTPGEIIPSREFYSYQSKYVDQTSQLLIPAPLSEADTQRVQDLALRVYETLQLEGMARIDFLMDSQTGEFWISEPNTIPGFTQISMYPKLWEASGLPYPQLLDELLELGLERHRRRQFSAER